MFARLPQFGLVNLFWLCVVVAVFLFRMPGAAVPIERQILGAWKSCDDSRIDVQTELEFRSDQTFTRLEWFTIGFRKTTGNYEIVGDSRIVLHIQTISPASAAVGRDKAINLAAITLTFAISEDEKLILVNPNSTVSSLLHGTNVESGCFRRPALSLVTRD